MPEQVTLSRSSSYHHLIGHAIRRIGSVGRGVRGLAKIEDCFGQLRDVLASLPLSTDEFSVGLNRLDNAQRYFTYDEHGAARYELKLLICSLEKKREQWGNPK